MRRIKKVANYYSVSLTIYVLPNVRIVRGPDLSGFFPTDVKTYDKGRPWQYIIVLTKAYSVGSHSGLTPLFPGVDKVYLSLTGKPP